MGRSGKRRVKGKLAESVRVIKMINYLFIITTELKIVQKTVLMTLNFIYRGDRVGRERKFRVYLKVGGKVLRKLQKDGFHHVQDFYP